MRVAIMQPYLFPYLGYFQLLHAVDKFVLLDDVNFINKGWVNRNRILLNGDSFFLTVPLQKASQNKLIHEIDILPEGGWKRKFLKTVELAYRKAPFFNQVYPMIESTMLSGESTIAALAYRAVKSICRYLDVEREIVATSVVYNNTHLKAQEKIIDICFREKADEYINPDGGKALYEPQLFKEKDISLKFLKPTLPSYRQFGQKFVPALSIIDVIMFNSREQVRQYLAQYELVED